MTGRSAARLGFSDRGIIAVGRKADLVVFDPDAIGDRGTPQEPALSPVGIDTVVVNGTVVLDSGKPTGARPGHALRPHRTKGGQHIRARSGGRITHALMAPALVRATARSSKSSWTDVSAVGRRPQPPCLRAMEHRAGADGVGPDSSSAARAGRQRPRAGIGEAVRSRLTHRWPARAMTVGVGAVFTPVPMRGRGYARAIIEALVDTRRAATAPNSHCCSPRSGLPITSGSVSPSSRSNRRSRGAGERRCPGDAGASGRSSRCRAGCGHTCPARRAVPPVATLPAPIRCATR